MRTVPHIEIRSLPAPTPQESQNQIQTANRRENSDFAETLKQKSAPNERAHRTSKDPEPAAKPAEAPKKASTTTRQRPTDDAPSSSDKATTDHLPVVDATPIDSSNIPVNPLTLGDLGIAHATAAVESADAALTAGSNVSQEQLASEITATTSATITGMAATNVAATRTTPADTSVASATNTATSALDFTQTTTKPAAVQTDQPAELPAAALINNGIKSADTAVEISSVAPNALTAVRGSKPAAPSTKVDDAQLTVSATNPSANDNDLSTVILPVLANDMVSKRALPAAKAALPASSSDNAPMAGATTALPTIAPINSATPATQATGMNAIAAAIGEKNNDQASDKSPPLETKTSSDSSLMPLQPSPTPQIAATRPMSDTVLAQSTLAANGNAMEKALSHQVSKALIQNMPNGDRVLVMRLTPPELGTVKIEVIERMGVLTAKLHAEDDGVRLALERFLPSMRQDLRASDAPIRELSLSDQTQFQRSFADSQNQQQPQQDADSSSNRRSRADEPHFSIEGIRNETVTPARSGAPLGGRVSLSEVNALA